VLHYRVLVFGKPQSPWRTSKERAERDAETLGVGSRDEWGDFYLSGEADFEEVHQYALMRLVEASPEQSTTIHGPVSQSARRRA
jgi:hypothetical protein